MLAIAVPANAGATFRTDYRYYSVGGTTERAIVSYMRQHPYTGNTGHAYANIKHRFQLDIDTVQDGKICKVEDIDLAISFVITLPKSSRPAALTRSARQSFEGFANFAKKHEETHRASFVDCGKSFVAKAKRQSAGQCSALTRDIRNLLRSSDRDCEAKQRSLDRRDSTRVNSLPLFRKGR
ncbi:MAG: DUF922 domain-containing protein [Devosia sp.]